MYPILILLANKMACDIQKWNYLHTRYTVKDAQSKVPDQIWLGLHVISYTQ